MIYSSYEDFGMDLEKMLGKSVSTIKQKAAPLTAEQQKACADYANKFFGIDVDPMLAAIRNMKLTKTL